MPKGLNLFPVVVKHKSGHVVETDTSSNRVVITAPDGTQVTLDKSYRWCAKCDGVRPLCQFTWRSMGETGEIRTQPHCERHPR